jgi:GLPGLI family protein
LTLLLCAVYSLPAQSPDPVKVRVYYKFRFMNDTTARTEFTNESMMLLIGEKMSVYQSYNSYRTDSIIKNRPANSGGGMISVSSVPMSGGSGAGEKQFTILAKNQLLSTKSVFVTQYLVDESAKQTQWNITGDTKEIGGITCQKATARVKGRDYAAWFAPELPYSLGPWKLNNLPGLILEASDSKGEVFFELERIASDATTATIEIPSKITPVSLAEYVKIKAAYDADPEGFRRANAPPPPPGMSVSNITVSGSLMPGAANVKRPVFNNKLEKEN